MPRPRDPNRDRAFDIYKSHKGNIDLVEIASQLNVSSGTIRGWKSKDDWERKMNGAFQKETERSKTKKKENPAAEDVISVMENTDLTDKQRLFCVLYVKCFNATKAYQKAYGCKYDIANAEGYKLLVNPCVKKEIQKLKQNRLNREMLDEHDIFQKYMDIAFADITDYVEFGRERVNVMGAFGPIMVADEDTGKKVPLMKNVNTVRFKDSAEVDGTIVTEVKQGRDGASIKLGDRMKALQWLSDHMDLATKEQRTKIAHMKAQTDKITGNNQEIEDMDEIESDIYGG